MYFGDEAAAILKLDGRQPSLPCVCKQVVRRERYCLIDTTNTMRLVALINSLLAVMSLSEIE